MNRILGLFKTSTLRDTLISFLGLGTTAGIGFVYTIVMARTLGPDKYGVFSAITSLAAIAYSLGDLGISSALINFIPKLADKRKVLISTTFWFQLFIATLLIVIFSVLAFFNQLIIPNSLPHYLLLAGLLSFNYLLIGYIQGLFTAERKFWFFSISQIVDAVVKIVLVFLFLSMANLSITSALISNILSTAVALIYSLSKYHQSIESEFSKRIFTSIFGFAKWIAVSRIFSVMFSKVDVILLNILASSHDAGIFAAASRVTLLFALLVSSLNSVINPRFSSFDKKVKVISYIKKLSLFIGGIASLMLLCVALARPIILLVFGESYQEAISVFQYMTLAMIPFLFSLITTPAILYTYNQPRFFAQTTAAQVILIIFMEIILIPSMGYYAPVVALGTTNVIIFFFTLLKLKTLIKNDHR